MECDVRVKWPRCNLALNGLGEHLYVVCHHPLMKGGRYRFASVNVPVFLKKHEGAIADQWGEDGRARTGMQDCRGCGENRTYVLRV